MEETVKYLWKTIVVERLELVRKEDIGTGTGKVRSAWNVYISPPTKNYQGLQEWRKLIRTVSFVTLSNAARKTRKIFCCMTCRSKSHPGGMCPLLDQPGWRKPPPPQGRATMNTPGPSTMNQGSTQPNRGGRNPKRRKRKACWVRERQRLAEGIED